VFSFSYKVILQIQNDWLKTPVLIITKLATYISYLISDLDMSNKDRLFTDKNKRWLIIIYALLIVILVRSMLVCLCIPYTSGTK